MKKPLVLVLTLVMFAAVGGCGSGVSADEHEQVIAEKESIQAQFNEAQGSLEGLQTENESLKAEIESLTGDLESIKGDLEKEQGDLASLQAEYDAYKESMKPYEELDAAEAEARKAAAEQEKESIEASKAAKKAEEESIAAESAAEESRQAEEKAKKGYDTGITYDQLARNPNDYIGEKIKFKGKVIQLIEDTDEIQIRLAVNSDYDTILFCSYDPSIVSSRVLEDDIITVYGTSVGTISYQSTMGGQITIPAALVDKIDQ